MKLRCLAPQSRSLLAFRGPDAVRYLNGQLTQDVRDLAESSLPACVTDAKGRLQAFVQVFRGPDDSLWVEAPPGQQQELEARLTRYLIADDVEVTDLSAGWQLLHVPGDTDPPEAGSGFIRRAARIEASGFDLWWPASVPLSELELITPAEAESRRIQARIPAWGAELTAGMLPPEAGLDRTAICYHKGCYIGQEVLSRIKTAGRLNRKLAAFLVDPDTPAGAALINEGKRAGTLTSVAPWANESGLHTALGYLEKSAFEAGVLAIDGYSGTARVTGFA